MAIMITIVLIVFLALIFVIEKTASHPMIILLGEWSIIFFLCTFSVYDYDISSKAYMIIFLGILSCIGGYFFSKNDLNFNVKCNEKINVKCNEKNIFSNTKLYLIFCIEIIMLIILMSYYENVKSLLDSGIAYGEIRYSYLKDVIGQNPVYNIIFSYLVRPFGIMMMPLSVYLLVKDRRKVVKLVFLIELVNVLLVTVVMGERMYLFYYAFFMITTYLCVRKSEGKNSSKRFKKIALLAIILFACVFVFISKSRISSGVSNKNENELVEKIQDTAYLYFSGCVSHLSQKVENFDADKSVDKYTYGVTSFQGVMRPLHQVWELVDQNASNRNSLFNKADDRKNEIESAILLGGHRFNGYISMFYYFYVDLNFIGVVIISFLISVWINWRYSYFLANKSSYSLIRYLLAVSTFAFSFFQFMLSNLDVPMAFVYCWLIFLSTNKIKVKLTEG